MTQNVQNALRGLVFHINMGLIVMKDDQNMGIITLSGQMGRKLNFTCGSHGSRGMFMKINIELLSILISFV